MATVIRIKRRLDEEPLDTVVVNCKKQKTHGSDSPNEISTIFKRSITLDVEDEDILKHVKQSTKCRIEDSYKIHIVDIHNKIKLENQNAARNNRYKVVNLHRSIEPSCNKEAEGDNGGITIVDLESDEKKEAAESSQDLQFVYDLYYTNLENFTEIDINELISVYPLSDNLVYDNADDDDGCTIADDSDSNDENNWRNDYPDESDVESITDEDMLNAMNKMDLNGENELSSDEGEENLVYSIDNEDFDLDVDPTDVNRYGEMYARFKAKVKRNEDNNSDYDSYSENSNEFNDSYY